MTIDVKSSVVLSEARNTQSSAGLAPNVLSVYETLERSKSVEKITPAEVVHKEDSNTISTKADRAPSIHSPGSLVLLSSKVNSTRTVAPVPAPPIHAYVKGSTALAGAEVKPSSTSLPQQNSTAPLLGNLRTLTTAHLQTGSINEPWSPISHTVSTEKHVSSNLSSGKLSNIKSVHTSSRQYINAQVNNSNDSTSIQNKTSSIERTQNTLNKEHKRGDIALLRTLALQESSQVLSDPRNSSSVVSHLNVTSVTIKQQLSALNQATPSLVRSELESSLLPISNNSDNTSTAQKSLLGTSGTKGVIMTRSALKETLHIQPSPTTRSSESSSMSLTLQSTRKLTPGKVVFSLTPTSGEITPGISRNHSSVVRLTSTSHTLEMVRSKSAFLSSPAQGMNVTTRSTLPGLTTGSVKATLATTSSQSVLNKVPRSSITLLTSSSVEVNSSSTTKKTLSSGMETLSILTSSLQANSQVASVSIVPLGGRSRISSSLQPSSSTTTKAIVKPSSVSASLPQDVSSPQNLNKNISALNNSSRRELETVLASHSRRVSTTPLTIPTKKTEQLASSSSKPPHHSEHITTLFKGESSATLLRWKHNQTSSSLQRAQDLLQSLQGYLSNMASKRQTIPRNRKKEESAKQNISHNSYEGSQVDKIVKELSSNLPNMPLIQALNHSVLRLVSNTSRNESDYITAKQLLNGIRKLLSHTETSLFSTLKPTARSMTQSMPTSSASNGKNFNLSSVGTNDTSVRDKSNAQKQGGSMKSSPNDKNVSLAYQSITKDDVTSQFSHSSSVATRIQPLSSIEDKQKRVEIPFAGRLLEQITLQHSSTAIELTGQTGSVPDSTPISGGLVEQIRRVHTRHTPRISSDNNSR
ncbi:uncharacterized protein LOC144665116 [Oculina patagonica]